MGFSHQILWANPQSVSAATDGVAFQSASGTGISAAKASSFVGARELAATSGDTIDGGVAGISVSTGKATDAISASTGTRQARVGAFGICAKRSSFLSKDGERNSFWFFYPDAERRDRIKRVPLFAEADNTHTIPGAMNGILATYAGDLGDVTVKSCFRRPLNVERVVTADPYTGDPIGHDRYPDLRISTAHFLTQSF